MQEPLTVGWIGFGKMGSPMSRRVRAAGHKVLVFDPREDSRDQVRAADMIPANSLAELAENCPLIFSSIPNDQVLLDVMIAPGGVLTHVKPDQVIVETSTVSPSASAQVAAAAAARGASYLRAPVSGSTATAETGTLSIMVSGPSEAYERALPLLKAFSRKQFYLGEREEARYLKLVLNAMVGATSALLAEALTLGRKGGLDVRTMLDVISQSAVASPLIDYKRSLLETDSFDAAFSVEQMMKDFDLILSSARAEHCPMYLVALIRQQYEAAFSQGDAEKDFFVLYQQYAKLAGL